MGAENFEVEVRKTEHTKTAIQAFVSAVENAKYKYGNDGYSGTIAEKNILILLEEVDSFKEARELSNQLMESNHKVYDDKWGPAGCITVKDQGWLFCGSAPS